MVALEVAMERLQRQVRIHTPMRYRYKSNRPTSRYSNIIVHVAWKVAANAVPVHHPDAVNVAWSDIVLIVSIRFRWPLFNAQMYEFAFDSQLSI